VDGVDTGGEVVGFELLFEEVEGADVVHDFGVVYLNDGILCGWFDLRY
jgi:hypothetical protein